MNEETKRDSGEIQSSKTEGAAIQLVLSKSHYNIGDSVVGIVRLLLPTTIEDNDNKNKQSFFFSEAKVYMAGKCKVDSRWHNFNQVSELYGSGGSGASFVHPLLQDVESSSENQQNSMVCFFATNVADLVSIPANKSKKIQQGENDSEKKAAVTTSGEFLFRIDLPSDIPPSAHALCCRYFYTVCVIAKVISVDPKNNGKKEENVIRTQIPVTIYSSALVSHNIHNNTRVFHLLQQRTYQKCRVKIGEIKILSLSSESSNNNGRGKNMHNFLSNIATPFTKLVRSAPQIEVSRTAPFTKICSSQSTSATSDVKLIRVANHEGMPCCILTIIGSTVMMPGSSVQLLFHFDPEFLLEDNNHEDNKGILSCLQIGVCLHGEEMVVNGDGKKETKTRAFLYDTSYSSLIDTLILSSSSSSSGSSTTRHTTTDQLTMTLTLPVDNISKTCTIKTDLVEVNVYLKIELTVVKSLNGDENPQVLTLELPCDVVHNLMEVEEDFLSSETSMNGLVGVKEGYDKNATSSSSPSSFGQYPMDVFNLSKNLENRKRLEKVKQQKSNDVVRRFDGANNEGLSVKDILGDLTLLSFCHF